MPFHNMSTSAWQTYLVHCVFGAALPVYILMLWQMPVHNMSTSAWQTYFVHCVFGAVLPVSILMLWQMPVHNNPPASAKLTSADTFVVLPGSARTRLSAQP